MQYFSLGKGDEFYLVDNARKKIYPEPYKQILNFFQFEKRSPAEANTQQKAKEKYETYIVMVLQDKDLNYKLLLGSGEIIGMEELEE